MQGVKRVALLGSLATTKVNPKDVDLLLTVEETMNLAQIATAGRKLQGRIHSLAHGNYGADLFVASPQHEYLGRLCKHRDCSGYRRSCEAVHCGQRPYLRDDLRSVTLEKSLVVAPPLDLWPTIITRVVVPPDVDEHLLQPLATDLGLLRSEQILPHSVRDRLIHRTGTMDQLVLTALHEAAAFLGVALTEEVECSFIEMHPVEHYAALMHFPLDQGRLTRLWVVELAGKTCFVAQSIQEGTVVFIVR